MAGDWYIIFILCFPNNPLDERHANCELSSQLIDSGTPNRLNILSIALLHVPASLYFIGCMSAILVNISTHTSEN